MGLVVSNGSRANIERSITHNALGTLMYPPENTVPVAIRMHPFMSIPKKMTTSSSPSCWGFQARGTFHKHWQRLFDTINNNLGNAEYMLLFENRNVPDPRVYTGKIVHIESNVNFGNALWQDPAERDKWYHIYFLTEIKQQRNNKSFFCSILGINDGQFPQHRVDNIPQRIAGLL